MVRYCIYPRTVWRFDKSWTALDLSRLCFGSSHIVTASYLLITNHQFIVELEWWRQCHSLLCNTQVVSGEARAFPERADWIVVNATAKWDFYFPWLPSLKDLLQFATWTDACLIHDVKYRKLKPKDMQVADLFPSWQVVFDINRAWQKCIYFPFPLSTFVHFNLQ